MAKYEIHYITLGTPANHTSRRLLDEIYELKSQKNPDESIINFLRDQHDEAIRSELEDTLNYYSSEGLELVQISQSLIEGKSVDGYALFRKDNSK